MKLVALFALGTVLLTTAQTLFVNHHSSAMEEALDHAIQDCHDNAQCIEDVINSFYNTGFHMKQNHGKMNH